MGENCESINLINLVWEQKSRQELGVRMPMPVDLAMHAYE